MNKRIYWSDEETKMLRKMANAGCTVDDILKVFKSRSIDGIIGKLDRIGISLKPLKAELDIDLYKKLMEGK
jgi:hypothetical protein